jgi:lipid-binding SYLF domain-containing protein
MNWRSALIILLAATALLIPTGGARGQTPEAETVAASVNVLEGFTTFHAQSIPQHLLADAQAVAIIPNVIKGGFVIAGRFGRGVVLVREPNGAWRAPVFVTFTGGSVGWQIGIQSTDVVLVFKNRKGIEKILTGSEFTLGADASIAAGPVGRQATAGTDATLNAEIYSYSRSRGLFAGVALDGSVLRVDNRATGAYYAGGTVVPEQAAQLAGLLARDTAVASGAAVPIGPVPGAADQLRQPLAEASQRLEALVDVTWRRYLALPPQVYAAGPPPAPAELTAALARYDRLVQDPQYRPLVERPEFRAAHDLLRRYLAAIEARPAVAPQALGTLPPPPAPAGGPPASFAPPAAAVPCQP